MICAEKAEDSQMIGADPRRHARGEPGQRALLGRRNEADLNARGVLESLPAGDFVSLGVVDAIFVCVSVAGP